MSSLDTALLDIAAKHAALADSVPRHLGRRPLTRRERQIAALVADGLSPEVIGFELFISPNVVRNNVYRLRRNCGVATDKELVAVIDEARMLTRSYEPAEEYEPRPATSVWRPGTLTRRQQEIALLIGDGLSNEEIADELELSADTVKSHVRRALEAVGARNRAHLAVMVREMTRDA